MWKLIVTRLMHSVVNKSSSLTPTELLCLPAAAPYPTVAYNLFRTSGPSLGEQKVHTS